MPSGPTTGKRLLVVEDDADVRHALTLFLEGAGHTVRTAANGREALEQLHANGRPDLIVLDLAMPVMNGWEFRGHQRRDPALADIPVGVLTAAGPGGELARVSCLPKPGHPA